MYKGYDFKSGMPPHLYRTLTEIRRDMNRISKEIADTNEKLNIRSMLIELLNESRYEKPRSIIPELEDIVGEAREALDRLTALQEELVMLDEELRATKCTMGV